MLADHLELGHRFSRRLRRLFVRRFPYGLLYRADADKSSSSRLHSSSAAKILAGSPSTPPG
jgi:hypothetical protein